MHFCIFSKQLPRAFPYFLSHKAYQKARPAMPCLHASIFHLERQLDQHRQGAAHCTMKKCLKILLKSLKILILIRSESFTAEDSKSVVFLAKNEHFQSKI